MLNARVKAFDLRNVEVVKGEAEDPRLPADRLASVLIVDMYHHFADHEAMLEQEKTSGDNHPARVRPTPPACGNGTSFEHPVPLNAPQYSEVRQE
jgi:hypothetical protein